MAVRLDAVDPPEADDVELGSITLAELWTPNDEPYWVPDVDTGLADYVDNRRSAAASAHVVAEGRFRRCTENLLRIVGQNDLAFVEIFNEVKRTPCMKTANLSTESMTRMFSG